MVLLMSDRKVANYVCERVVFVQGLVHYYDFCYSIMMLLFLSARKSNKHIEFSDTLKH